VDFFLHTFEQSGVTTWLFLPPLVMFVISFFAAMGGVSGAFLLLPFQISVLGYSAPSVSATNHVYNAGAIPSGVWAYIREKRMLWPLAWTVTAATLPGVLIGAWMRIAYLPNPTHFKIFAGIVLLYIGARLSHDVIRGVGAKDAGARPATSATSGGAPGPETMGHPKAPLTVTDARLSMRRGSFKLAGEEYTFSTPVVFLISLVVGVTGGIYGIGGGAIMAPLFVTLFRLPVYAIAGAALLGTFVTSAAAVVFYHVLAFQNPELSVSPDWPLGLLFAAGGIPGLYLGARFQRRMPARFIKSILCVFVFFMAIRYVAGLIR
jgi:uncharacterized membrane protein YfcA